MWFNGSGICADREAHIKHVLSNFLKLLPLLLSLFLEAFSPGFVKSFNEVISGQPTTSAVLTKHITDLLSDSVLLIRKPNHLKLTCNEQAIILNTSF